MTIPEEGYLLRIFIGESDRDEHHPLYHHRGTENAETTQRKTEMKTRLHEA